LDSQKVISNGEYGLTATRVRVRLEDGKEISRQKEDQWTAKEPKNRVVGFGTNVVMHSLDTPDGTIYYWRALTMWITSYSDAVGSTTASGQKVRKGLVGVNPHYIPYGTKMYVPGYGMAEAADTGNIGPRWIDLGYTQDEYVAWHQYSTVYFLWPPPANIIYQYPR
jgi:3D (Asp-Asp-Asp) domain-containing protein